MVTTLTTVRYRIFFLNLNWVRVSIQISSKIIPSDGKIERDRQAIDISCNSKTLVLAPSTHSSFTYLNSRENLYETWKIDFCLRLLESTVKYFILVKQVWWYCIKLGIYNIIVTACSSNLSTIYKTKITTNFIYLKFLN